MSKQKTQEKGIAHVRIYPSTHKRLRLLAARKGLTLVEIIDQLSKGA
jgi:predicted HicB family RNase H-like nuclease